MRIGSAVTMPCGTIGCILIFSLVFCSFASAAPCTPSTCPDGPVIARFEYANCTGEVIYEPYTANWGACVDKKLAVKSETEIRIYQFFSSGCSTTSESSVFYMNGYTFGICTDLNINNARRSSDFSNAIDVAKLDLLNRLGIDSHQRDILASVGAVVLPNVNASFEAPQAVFQANPLVPLYNETVVGCDGINNCTLPNGDPAEFWITTYSGSNCQGTGGSLMQPYIDLVHGCYIRENSSYFRRYCINVHSYGVASHISDDCSDTPAIFGATQFSCQPGSNGVIQCLAGLSVPEEVPTGSSPTTPNPPTETPSSNADSIFNQRLALFSTILGFFIMITL